MRARVKRGIGRRLRTERVYSQMASSAVQKSLIANLVQSLRRPPGPEAVLLRRLRLLVHQSQGSEPFTSFPRDLPGRQPQCWTSLLNWLEKLRTRGRWERGRIDAIYRTGTGDFLSTPLGATLQENNPHTPKPSPPQDPFQQFTF